VGVEREVALKGMWAVTPDVGAMTCRHYRHEVPGEGIREVEFINAFAANDPDSYCRVWERLNLGADPQRVIILMNIRSDRQRRSRDLAPLFGRELKAAHYVLIGGDTALFGSLLRRQGVARDLIHDYGNLKAPALWDRLVSLGPDGSRIIGIGNIKGIGHDLLNHLQNVGVAE
jgi:hypothetical protein